MTERTLSEKELENRFWPQLYQLHKSDEAAFPHFYLFIAAFGGFYIMKEDSAGSIMFFKNEFTARGQWSDAWKNRAILNYSSWDLYF